MKPIECLFERDDLPRARIPPSAATLYGGDFGLPRQALYANFVVSIDGVAGLEGPGESGAIISGQSEPDRFVMGLLRAFADAVLIGAGTFRATADSLWWPETVFPPAATDFTELRASLGLRPHPLLVLVTASGAIDTAQPALNDCWILTTAQGEARLRGTLPSGARVVVTDLSAPRIWIDQLRHQGLQSILNEGGPSLFGQLLKEGLVDELFVTMSPKLFGRSANDGRKSLISGVDLSGHPMELLSARRHQAHLFLRYRRNSTNVTLKEFVGF